VDIAQCIQLHLVEIAKNGYIRAQDVIDFVTMEKIQDMLGSKKRGICVRTAQRWLTSGYPECPSVRSNILSLWLLLTEGIT
jgi:hypothetical protein